jgi:hypothetical protein
MGAPEVPHGTELHCAQATAVLDHSRTLPQGDGSAGPEFAGGAVGGECNLIVLDAGDASPVHASAFGPRSQGGALPRQKIRFHGVKRAAKFPPHHSDAPCPP